MKGLEKLTCIRLAEVLTQRGTVETDAITDALYAQDRQGEIFVEVLVNNGHIGEWDLAKIVVEHFQLPFVMAGNLDISDEAKAVFPKEALFKHNIVPLDVFENAATVALPILTPFDALARLEEQTGKELFAYVGLISENNRVLGEMFDDFKDWQKAERERRDAQARSTPKRGRGGNWMDMFDSADASVRDGLKDE